jgi:photosystem II stability/assembly factor-like uncharacterized protein
VLVATDMTAGFASEDGGETWRQFNLRTMPNFFIFDPIQPNVIYAGLVGGAGTMRSEDRGRTWSQFYPMPMTRIALLDDEAETYVLTERGYVDPLHALVIDPTDSNVMYATAGLSLQKTIDGGKTWTTLVTMKNGTNRMFMDTNSPKGNRSLYVTGGDWVGAWENGVWRVETQPSGTTWIYDAAAGTPKDGGPMALYLLVDESVDPNKGPLVVSEDGARTWRPFYQGILDLKPPNTAMPYFRAIGVCATNPDAVYISYSRLELPDAERGIHHIGVVKTLDRGKTWTVVWRDTNKNDPNVDEPWLSERFSTEWGENPHQIGVHPSNPDIVYTTDLGRTMRTTNGGATWKGVYSKRVNPETWTTTGIDVLTGYGLHFDPFEKNRLFASFTDVSLFRSEDRGSTWRDSAIGAPRAWRNTTYWIEFDPAVKGRMWAAMSAIHDLPRMKMIYKMRPSDVWDGGIAMSEDGGLTWKASNQGMPPTAATHVLLEPTSPVEARVLWAVGFGTGVYKSVDGGASWTLKNKGLSLGANGQPTVWRMHRDAKGTLYLVVARRAEDGKADHNAGAVYRSTDGAESWERMTLPEGVTGPTGINTDPRDPNRVYMTAHGRFLRYAWLPLQPAGLYISTDAGAHWKLVFDKDQYLYDITYDPGNPDVMYMTGFTSSAYRSADKGQTWTRIAGFNFKAGHRIFPDPQDPEMIYITTYGSSIWYGPWKGDGKLSDEDIVPPGVPYGGLTPVAKLDKKSKPESPEKAAKAKKKKNKKDNEELAQR